MRLNDLPEPRAQLRLLRAMKRIRVEMPGEFEVIMDALKAASDQTDVDLRQSEQPVSLYRLQGRAEFITELAQLWIDCPQVEALLRENMAGSGHGVVAAPSAA